MSTPASPTPRQKLWGIYYTDREHAGELGDPLRTVVEASTKEAAGKLGFESPWAHPVIAEQARHALWLTKRKRHQRQLPVRRHSQRVHV